MFIQLIFLNLSLHIINTNSCGFQVRKGHSMITQKDIIDVLDKQLLEGMGVLLTEEEQQKCEASVCTCIS